MGLIKAITGAAGGVLGDQWREFFYCEAMGSEVLASKGYKSVNKKRSSNTSASENIITNGSVVVVNEGQFMMIVDNGRIIECTDQVGAYTYDKSESPTIFFGDFGDGVLQSLKEIGSRLTFGGDAGRDQRVYFLNKKEILGNKYGTPAPVPFRVVDNKIGLDIDVAIRCHGEYSYRITDPVLFYTNVCGNVTDRYTRDNLDSQLKSELLTALQPMFARISEAGIRYSALPGHTMEMSRLLNELLSDKWSGLRGISIVSFGVSSVKASDEDEALIKNLQKTAIYTNPSMAAAGLVGAQADAMVAAAKNPGGAALAFAGMNLAQNAGGNSAQQLFGMAAQEKQAQEKRQAAADEWTCECGEKNTAKFCPSCGKARPQITGWVCECGTLNKGKFCAECGLPKPSGTRAYKCDKCGWEPADASKPPKFCPECGDLFDDKDVVK